MILHNVIAELSNDPENTDAVKEAKLALKDKKKRELTAVLQEQKQNRKQGARAKAKAKAKPKAKAKAKAQAMPKGMVKTTIAAAKAKAQTRPNASANSAKKPRLSQRPDPAGPPAEPPADPVGLGVQLFGVKEEPEEEGPFYKEAAALMAAQCVITVSEFDDAGFWDIGEQEVHLEESRTGNSRSSRDVAEDEIICPGPGGLTAGVDPTCTALFNEIMSMVSDAAEDVPGQPEFPQGASEPDAADHPVAPGGSDSQAVASSSAPAKIRNYPVGTHKHNERPEIMKKLDCGCAGGKITLDPHVHRFCASHEHTVKQVPILVGTFIQKSSNRSFGGERTWQEALKECHFWLWTKHSRLCPKKPTILQEPGSFLMKYCRGCCLTSKPCLLRLTMVAKKKQQRAVQTASQKCRLYNA